MKMTVRTNVDLLIGTLRQVALGVADEKTASKIKQISIAKRKSEPRKAPGDSQ